MDNSLMSYIGAFIAVAIMLGIGTLILGGTGTDCTTITGYTTGEVTGVTIDTAGNYTSDPTVTFTGGGGSGATGTVVTSAIANGFAVSAITVTNVGSSYSTAPTVNFVGGAPVNTTAVATAIIGADSEQTGWALACVRSETQSQAGYALMIITLVVLAAVVVLTVVRMLS